MIVCFDLVADLLGSNAELIALLEIHPESRRSRPATAQPSGVGGISGHGPFAGNQLI